MSVRTFLNNFITFTQDFRFFSVFPLSISAFKGGPFLKEMVKKAIERELDDIPHEGGLIECMSKKDKRKIVSNAPSKSKQIENMGFKDMSQTVDIFIEEISIRF